MAFCRSEYTIHSTDKLAWQAGDGYSVSQYCIDHEFIELTDNTTVINGVISLPVAALAFFLLPDTPGTAKANWVFSEKVKPSPLAQRILDDC